MAITIAAVTVKDASTVEPVNVAVLADAAAASAAAIPPAVSGASSGGSFPDETTTGVPSGTTLTTYTGPTTISTNDAVIDSKTITSELAIRATGVIIKNSLVQFSAGPSAMINCDSEGVSVTVQDTTIDGENGDGKSSGLLGNGYTVLRCNISNVGEGCNMADDITVQDSYIHDLYGADSSHNNALISNGGGNYEITGNRLDAIYNENAEPDDTTGITSALSLLGDFSAIHDVLIANNLLASGGTYCTYGGSVSSKLFPHASNVQYLDNSFSIAGSVDVNPVADYDDSEPGNAWSGNTWADGPDVGQTIATP